MSNMDPYVSFQERYTGADGDYHYLDLMIDSFTDGWRMAHPPVIGDLVVLRDPRDCNTKSYRVVDRRWTYPQYGSQHWPTGSTDPIWGPRLDVVVQAGEELYREETSSDF